MYRRDRLYITDPDAERKGSGGMSAFFGGLISPKDEVIRGKIGEGLSAAQVGDLITGIVRRSVTPDSYGPLMEAEISERDYFGPQSPLPSWDEVRERVKQEWNYQPQLDLSPDDLTNAIMWLRSLIPANSLRSWSMKRTLDEMDLTTNSGFPFFTRRSTVVQPSVSLAERALRTEGYRALYIYGSRAKPTEDTPERRTVYMAQFHLNIIEKMIQMPLTNALRRTGFFTSWEGPEEVDRRFKNLSSLRKGQTLVSFDASGFDWHIHHELIMVVQDIVTYWFQPSDAMIIDRCFNHVLDSDLLTPDGIWEGSEDGIKSGWGLTNVVDSLINVLALVYVQHRLGLNTSLLGDGLPQLNGDDAVFRMLEDVTSETLETGYDELGFKVSARKQHISTNFVTFNSRVHIDGFDGIRPLWRFARGFFFPERANIVSDKGHTLIALAKLHTIETHPGFLEMARQIKAMDDFGLGTIGKHSLDSITSGEVVQEVKDSLKIDVKNEQRGSLTLRGLKQWKIVRLLRQGVI
jgi:hypothetical protein